MNKQIDEMAKALRYAVNEKHGYISMRGLAEALYNAGIRKQNEWIPVTERLPRRDEYVLCYSEYDTIFIGYRGFHSGEWQVNGFPCKIDITHWKPLPEPPEAEKGR